MNNDSVLSRVHTGAVGGKKKKGNHWKIGKGAKNCPKT